MPVPATELRNSSLDWTISLSLATYENLMMPWGHLLVAALPVIAYTTIRHQRVPDGMVLFGVVLGSQFPDLIDKPLA